MLVAAVADVTVRRRRRRGRWQGGKLRRRLVVVVRLVARVGHLCCFLGGGLSANEGKVCVVNKNQPSHQSKEKVGCTTVATTRIPPRIVQQRSRVCLCSVVRLAVAPNNNRNLRHRSSFWLYNMLISRQIDWSTERESRSENEGPTNQPTNQQAEQNTSRKRCCTVLLFQQQQGCSSARYVCVFF